MAKQDTRTLQEKLHAKHGHATKADRGRQQDAKHVGASTGKPKS